MTPKKRKAPSDKERLDWLTRQDFCTVQRADSKLGKWFCYLHATTTYYYAKTPRAAIRAAMRADKGGSQ